MEETKIWEFIDLIQIYTAQNASYIFKFLNAHFFRMVFSMTESQPI